MSIQVSPTLYIDSLRRTNFCNYSNLNKTMHVHHCPCFHIPYINIEKRKNNTIKYNNIENNYLEPTFDINTDYKFIKTYNSNNPDINLLNKDTNLYDINNTPKIDINQKIWKLSDLSINKYKKMKNRENSSNDNILDKNNSVNEKESYNDNNNCEYKNNEKNNAYKYYDLNINNNLKNDNIDNVNNSNNNKNKLIPNSLDKNNNNKKEYYFDYKNDKNKDNSPLDNRSLNREYNNLNHGIDKYSNNRNNLQTNYENINNQNNLLLENNEKSNKILNETNSENFSTNKNSENYLINYLKKENEELKKINTINTQIINNLFYFINQLSQKFSPDKKSFDLSHYSVNLNDLPTDLHILNEYILNSNNINNEEYSNKNNNLSNNKTFSNNRKKKQI